MLEGIEYDRWDICLSEFNRRNRWRRIRLRVFDESGTQETKGGLPLVGISLEAGREGHPRIHIMLEDHGATHQRQQTITITGVKRVTPNRATNGRDESLEIEDELGEKNLLLVEPLSAGCVDLFSDPGPLATS